LRPAVRRIGRSRPTSRGRARDRRLIPGRYSHRVPIHTLADPESPELADYTRMTDVALRRSLEAERGLFMAESSTVIRRAVAAGHRPRSFLMAPKYLSDLDPLLRGVGAG